MPEQAPHPYIGSCHPPLPALWLMQVHLHQPCCNIELIKDTCCRHGTDPAQGVPVQLAGSGHLCLVSPPSLDSETAPCTKLFQGRLRFLHILQRLASVLLALACRSLVPC